MPIILYGVRGYTIPTQSGDFFCPDCISDAPYAKKLSFTAVHLYFIPIIPFQFESYVECKSCWSTFRPTVLEWDPRKDPAFPSAWRQAVLETMALMMVADGEVDESEIARTQHIYEAMTSRPLSREEVLAEVDKHDRGADLLATLVKVRPGLNWQGREAVLKAAMQVAMADGVLTDEESMLLREIGDVLTIPAPRSAAIWDELSASQQLRAS